MYVVVLVRRLDFIHKSEITTVDIARGGKKAKKDGLACPDENIQIRAIPKIISKCLTP